MPEVIIKAELLPLRGTADALKAKNPMLKAGQIGVETNTGLIKVGNGVVPWNQLDYYPNINVQIGDTRPAINEPETLSNLEEGDNVSTLFGKIKRVFATLKAVAFTGSYSDLSNTPDLKPVATTGLYNDLEGKPELEEVAYTGSYLDLIDKPLGDYEGVVSDRNSYAFKLNDLIVEQTTPDGKLQNTLYVRQKDPMTEEEVWWPLNSYGNLPGKPNLATVATTGFYNDLVGRYARCIHIKCLGLQSVIPIFSLDEFWRQNLMFVYMEINFLTLKTYPAVKNFDIVWGHGDKTTTMIYRLSNVDTTQNATYCLNMETFLNDINLGDYIGIKNSNLTGSNLPNGLEFLCTLHIIARDPGKIEV